MENLNNNFTCKDAELHYYDFICGNTNCSVPDGVIKHIHSCENCLEKIEQLKLILQQPEDGADASNNKAGNEINHMLERHFAYLDQHVGCDDVKPFLPYLLNTELDIKIPTPITVHINKCSKCHQDMEAIRRLGLDKDQLSLFAKGLLDHTDADAMAMQLNEHCLPQGRAEKIIYTFSKISERPESGISTIYRIDREAETNSNKFDLYAGFPITVEQTDNNTYQDEQNWGAAIPFKTNTTSNSNAAPLSRLLKPGIVAAAVILIAVGVFFSTPTVKAVSIGQIYRAMDKIKNIYIANFAPGGAEPRQEFWVSREQNVYLTKTENETVFYDFDNGQRKVKLSGANTIENIQLTEDMISSIKPEMYSLFGIMPFADISDIPADAQWIRVTKNDDGVEIYDLIWANQELTGAKGYWKYKFYVDTKTNLPFKIELYSRLSIGEDYTLVNLRLVKYLDSDEFEAMVREKGF